MFRNRRNSQKPNEEFYEAFKQNFPGVGPGTSSIGEGSVLRSTSLSDALTDANVPNRQFGDLDEVKEHDATPKAYNDSWRFTPSLMDPNSFAFANFAAQPPGYYTPTPGGVNTLYHSQAGDLHTPGMGMSIGTPLSLPHTSTALHAQDPSMGDLQFHQAQFMQNHHFQNSNPFSQNQQQQAFHPSSFLHHQDSGYEAMDQSPHKSPPNPELDMRQHHGSHQSARMSDSLMAGHTVLSSEKFRYHVTLNAPTAMIKHSDEIPITYLNKGQAYTMSVIDTTPLAPTPGPIKYRTFVRVSFEDEQQRAKPSACWQLWKEGRGTNEAHQRGGKLLAVEYVDPNQGGDDETRRPQIEVESASFDGFCVTWTPNPMTGGADCAISVRFNFLSTDFSHSKGVKGIPVRLCAKTEMIMPSPAETTFAGEPEVCYCKVKLFRDHGAERKLSNDVAHVKKTIDKLQQQIAQAESGMGSFGKRKRDSIAKAPVTRPGKVMKHKRTWSMDSDGEGSGRPSAEEDLHVKLATMQDMFSSTRPVSVLFLRGDEPDDPDNFPVQIVGESQDLSLIRTQTWDSKQSVNSTPTTSNIVSPSPSSVSVPSVNRSAERKQAVPQSATTKPASRQGSMEWPQPQSPETSTKVQRRDSSGVTGGWINATGIDKSYQPPPELPIKPVACFYVIVRQPSARSSSDLYRAVYLMRRTVKDLVNGISEKCGVNRSRVTRAVRVNSKGIKIVLDEDVVQQIPEGQDMVVEFYDVHYDSPVKAEFSELSVTELLSDGDLPLVENATSDGLEMRLAF